MSRVHLTTGFDVQPMPSDLRECRRVLRRQGDYSTAIAAKSRGGQRKLSRVGSTRQAKAYPARGLRNLLQELVRRNFKRAEILWYMPTGEWASAGWSDPDGHGYAVFRCDSGAQWWCAALERKSFEPKVLASLRVPERLRQWLCPRLEGTTWK